MVCGSKEKPLAEGKHVVPGTWTLKKKVCPTEPSEITRLDFCSWGFAEDFQQENERGCGCNWSSNWERSLGVFRHPLTCCVTGHYSAHDDLWVVFEFLVQTDWFFQLFCQSWIREPGLSRDSTRLWIKENSDMVLELHRSLHGQIGAPKLWHSKLRNGMKAQECKTSGWIPTFSFLMRWWLFVVWMMSFIGLRTTLILRSTFNLLWMMEMSLIRRWVQIKMLLPSLESKSTRMRKMVATSSLKQDWLIKF